MCCVMGYTGHDLSAAKFKEYLLRTVMRGPDDQRVVEGPFGLMGFGRLAIMGLTPEGMQPFYRGADCVVCNGELYGFRFEKEILKRRGYKFASDCDCEILLPLYYEYGLDMFRHMDSEFALILYDSRKDRLIAARDPIGIRPLFYGYSKSSHQIAFASEMQNLIGWCDDIRPFPIGSYYCDGRFVRYEDIADVPAPMEDDMETTLRNIREKLIAGVEKRLDAAHITCNKNTVPNDPRSPFVTSGVRLGTAAVTSRGMNEEDMDQIAEAIALMVKDKENIGKAKAIVKQLTDKYPLNA